MAIYLIKCFIINNQLPTMVMAIHLKEAFHNKPSFPTMAMIIQLNSDLITHYKLQL